MISMKIKLSIFLVIVVAIALFLMNNQDSRVPVLAEYESRVIYTTDLSVPKEILVEDCSMRGGSFNSCGTPCAPEEEACTAICAYTCEL